MKREIIVANDFYADPDAVIRYAKSLPYYSPFFNSRLGSSRPEDMAQSSWFTSMFKEASECPFKSSEEFILKLQGIVGEEIDRDHWNKGYPENPDGTITIPRPDLIDPNGPYTFENLIPDATSCRWNCAFNVKIHEQMPGTGVHSNAKDRWNMVGEDGWAGLIYLNKDAPRDSGLKTYKNKLGNDLEWMTASDRWELIDDFANIFNRLILVRGRWPHVGGSGFGSGIQDGRLFQTLFFKTNPVEIWDSCKIEI